MASWKSRLCVLVPTIIIGLIFQIALLNERANMWQVAVSMQSQLPEKSAQELVQVPNKEPVKPKQPENVPVQVPNKEPVKPKQPEKVPVQVLKGKFKFCCKVGLNANAGHTFTDVTVQLNQCGPIISIIGAEHIKFSKQVFHLAEILNKTRATHNECIEYYTQFPEQHPKQHYPCTFALMANAGKTNYDAYEIGRNLREAQNKLLSACGLKPPLFENEISTGSGNVADGRIFEKFEADRPPATRVIILVRRPMRMLTNAQDLLPMCSDLKVDCQIIDLNEYWSNKETTDLCYVLKTFENSVIIGMQGAEIIYPLLLGLRLNLVSIAKKEDIDNYIDGRHYGTARIEDGEFEAGKNLVRSGTYIFDPFFPEFALHFGAELNAISGEWRNPAESDIPNKAEILLQSFQCRQPGNPDMKVEGIHDYCLDMDINIAHIKLILEKYIEDGHLLVLQNELE